MASKKKNQKPIKGKVRKTAKKVVRKIQELKPFPRLFNFKIGFIIALVVMIACGSFIFWQYLSNKKVYIFEDIGSDTITLFYPQMLHGQSMRKDGFSPPYKYSFYKSMGENSYRTSPPQLTTFFGFLFSGKSVAERIPITRLVYIIGGGLLFFFFIKSITGKPLLSLLGAVLFAFSGYYIVGSSWYGHGNTIFHMMIVILGVELAISKKQWWLIPIGVLYMIDPRLFFLTEFLIVYTIVRALDVYNFDIKKLLKLIPVLIFAGILGFALAGPALGTKYNKLKYSPRVGGKVSYARTLKKQPVFQLAKAEHNGTVVMRTFNNDLLGSGKNYEGWRNHLEAPLFYCGLLILLLIPQLFVFLDRKRKILYGLFLGVWLLLIIFPYFRFIFYNFVGDYYKAGLSLFIPISMLVCALMAFKHILDGKKPNLIVLGISLIVLLAFLFIPTAPVAQFVDHSIQWKVAILLVLYAGILAAISFLKKPQILLPIALVALSIFEVTYFSQNTNTDRESIAIEDWNTKTRHNDYTNEAVAFTKTREDNPLFFRTDKTYGSVKSGYNDAIAQAYFGTKSYQSFNNNNIVRFLDINGLIDGSKEYNTRWLVGLSRASILHPLASIKYLLSNDKTFQLVDKKYYKFIQKEGDVEIYENKFFIPMGMPFDQYIPFSEFDQLSVNQKHRVLYNAIVLEDKDLQNADGLTKYDISTLGKPSLPRRMRDLKKGAMQMTYFNHSEIEGTIDMEKEGFVYFSIPYEPGWSAKVDGKDVPVFLAHIGFTGVKVPAGSHEIILEFFPPLNKIGGLISKIAMGVFLLLLLFTWGRTDTFKNPREILPAIKNRFRKMNLKESNVI